MVYWYFIQPTSDHQHPCAADAAHAVPPRTEGRGFTRIWVEFSW